MVRKFRRHKTTMTQYSYFYYYRCDDYYYYRYYYRYDHYYCYSYYLSLV